MGGEEPVKKLIEIDPNFKAIVSSGYLNDPLMSEFRKYCCGNSENNLSSKIIDDPS